MRARWVVAGAIAALGLLGAGAVVFAGPAPEQAKLTGTPERAEPVAAESIIFDESTAILTSQNETTQTWTDAQGVSRTQVYVEPQRVFRDGEWVPTSNVLEDSGDTRVAVDNVLSPELPETIEDGRVLTVTASGNPISYSLVGARDGATGEFTTGGPDTSTSTAVYEDVFPGVDATYEVASAGVKEVLVVADEVSVPTAVTWRIDAPGLAARTSELGTVEFVNADGTVVAHVPAPLMWDAAESGEGAAVSLDFTLEELSPGAYEFTVTPDPAWVGSHEREFPLYLDPSVGWGPTYLYALKSDGTVMTDAARIGKLLQSSTWRTWRTVVHYPYENLFGSRIIGATQNLTKVAGVGTVNCYDGHVQSAWSNSFNAYNNDYLGTFAICGGNGSVGGTSSAMAYFYASLVAVSSPGSAVMLFGYEDQNVTSYKQVTTSVTFDYVSAAVVTGVEGQSPVRASATAPVPQRYVDDVVLQAMGTDYSQTGQLFRYNIALPGGGVWQSPWVESGPYRVPDTVLTPGQTYTYSISTHDKHAMPGPTTTKSDPLYTFQVRVAPPQAIDVSVRDGEEGPVFALTSDLVLTDDEPQLIARVALGDSTSVRAVFTVVQISDDNGPPIVVAESVPGSLVTPAELTAGVGESSVKLPYPLVPGAVYQVQVQTFDGHMASQVVTPPGKFTGPPRSIREIPWTNDGSTGATS